MSFMTDSNATDTESGTAAALNADAIASVDASDYQCAYIQILGTFVGTLTFQGSNNNTDFEDVLAVNVSSAIKAPQVSTSVPGIFYLPTPFRFFRLRMTAYTSGSASSMAFFQRVPSGDLAPRGARLTDGVDQSEITSLGDLRVDDVPQQQGVSTILSLTTTAIEGKVGLTAFPNRKYIEMEALDGKVKWGYDASCPFDLFKNAFFALPLGPDCKIYLKMSAGTGQVAFSEK